MLNIIISYKCCNKYWDQTF